MEQGGIVGRYTLEKPSKKAFRNSHRIKQGKNNPNLSLQPLQRCIVRIIFHIKIIIFAIAKRCYSCCNVVIGKRLKPTPIKNCLQCNLKFHNKNAPFSKELKKGCIIEGTNIRATEICMISFKVIQNFRAFLLIRKKFGEKRGSFELSKMFYIFPSSFILMNDFQSIYHAMKSILSTSS